jgi:hypothetical protein
MLPDLRGDRSFSLAVSPLHQTSPFQLDQLLESENRVRVIATGQGRLSFGGKLSRVPGRGFLTYSSRSRSWSNRCAEYQEEDETGKNLFLIHWAKLIATDVFCQRAGRRETTLSPSLPAL